jgi:hypothetical protein
MGVLCATWHKINPKSINPKIRGQNKISGLIQKCSSNQTTKRMVTKIYHAKLTCIGSIQNGAYMH